MKSIKLLGFLLGLMLLAGKVSAADPVAYEERSSASRYATSQSTMIVHSSGPVTIAGSTGYREVTIFNASNLVGGATVYYREDGFSTLISTIGTPIFPQRTERIETQNPITLQINGGPTTTTTIRRKIKQK